MRLPLKTEYACQVLAQLASSYTAERVRQVEELAAAEKLSPNYLVQILTTLRKSGLVVSRRGKYGGYLLSRPPEEITLAEIALAMEGGALVESSPGNGGASAGKVREAWLEVDRSLREVCGRVLLSELAPDPVGGQAGDWVI